MSAEDAIRFRGTEPEASAEPSDPAGSPQGRLFFALAGVMQSTLDLISANAALTFAEGAHARRELERALSTAELLVDALPEGPAHADALRRFQDIRSVAMRQLAIAPAPGHTTTDNPIPSLYDLAAPSVHSSTIVHQAGSHDL